MLNFNVLIQHVYREGNSLVDFLSNQDFVFAGTTNFYSFSELPCAGRKILNLDKIQTPNLRFRAANNPNHH
ncbi:hypothetical protein MTR67_012918 [Solanum verrucosum]|uniref:RNase H type-1 domain-containing protein n=1 Tax=Solanum verrucosum TaxID=315347 RepID=A0AAF0QBC8_SOLVR|nr:hypothetical protein MTR67_012918 [Solanum verrucosum]